MSGSRLAVTTILAAVVVVGVGGCADGTQSAGWRLDSTLADAGSGIPFCDEVTANVADFMSQYEGQAPPSDRYGGGTERGTGKQLPGANRRSRGWSACPHVRPAGIGRA